MPLNRKHFTALTAGLALTVTAAAGMAGSNAGLSQSTRCEILATNAGGQTMLEGVVHADETITGTYSFRVESAGGSGRSQVKQGGEFSAAPGTPARIGQVTLGGSGTAYDATLEVTTADGSVECQERIGGI